MATLNLSDFEPVLKIDYLDMVNDNSNRTHVFLSRLTRNSEAVGGNFAHLAILRRGNPGVGYRGESTTLPAPNFSKHTKATYAMKTLYGRGKISGQTTRAAIKGSTVAFVDALDAELSSLVEDLPQEHNRMLFGHGTGQLAICDSTLVDSLNVPVDSTQYIQVDDVIDIIEIAGGGDSEGLARTVTGVTTDVSFAVATTAVTATITTSLIMRAGSRVQEIFGLRNSHSDADPVSQAGDFGNIDRDTSPFWKAQVDVDSWNNTRPLTQGQIQDSLMKSHTGGGGKIDFAICHPDVWITYGNLLAPGQRFGELIHTMDGGFESLKMVRTDLTFDKDCENNRIYFCDMRALMLLEYDDGYQFMEADGSILRYASSGELDEVVFAMLKDAQFASSACNRQVLLGGIEINKS